MNTTLARRWAPRAAYAACGLLGLASALGVFTPAPAPAAAPSAITAPSTAPPGPLAPAGPQPNSVAGLMDAQQAETMRGYADPGPNTSRGVCAQLVADRSNPLFNPSTWPLTQAEGERLWVAHTCSRWYPGPTKTTTAPTKTTQAPAAPGTLEGMLKQTAPPPAQQGSTGTAAPSTSPDEAEAARLRAITGRDKWHCSTFARAANRPGVGPAALAAAKELWADRDCDRFHYTYDELN